MKIDIIVSVFADNDQWSVETRIPVTIRENGRPDVNEVVLAVSQAAKELGVTPFVLGKALQSAVARQALAGESVMQRLVQDWGD